MAKNQVIITVSGGFADVQRKPDGVTVLILDYDCEGSTLLSKDHLGDDCLKSEWERSGKVTDYPEY